MPNSTAQDVFVAAPHTQELELGWAKACFIHTASLNPHGLQPAIHVCERLLQVARPAAPVHTIRQRALRDHSIEVLHPYCLPQSSTAFILRTHQTSVSARWPCIQVCGSAEQWRCFGCSASRRDRGRSPQPNSHNHAWRPHHQGHIRPQRASGQSIPHLCHRQRRRPTACGALRNCNRPTAWGSLWNSRGPLVSRGTPGRRCREPRELRHSSKCGRVDGIYPAASGGEIEQRWPCTAGGGKQERPLAC